MTDPQPTAPSWSRVILDRIRTTDSPSSSSHPYPPISSIPLTKPSRLSLPDARCPTPLPIEPIPATTLPPSPSPTAPTSILYLAYGSNLCAKTFLGTRGIRPLSQINVSAPSLRLVFDLPGLPYVEPCFANTAIRKIPKLPLPEPPKFPPGYPQPPQPPTSSPSQDVGSDSRMPGDAHWDKGLIGVVYEVTPQDYAKIIATEGGGAGYKDVLVPCVPLPPRMGLPEKPDWPELPKVFVAHTLFAPRVPGGLPGAPGGGGDGEEGGDGEDKKGHVRARTGDNDNDGDNDKSKLPLWLRRWLAEMILPVSRPMPEGYAQPSARYLKLIRDGAREHELPDEYQLYLSRLQHYSITRPSQSVGMVLLVLVFGLPFALGVFGGRLFADKEGKVPRWVAVYMAVLLNTVWGCYDRFWKGTFGDGERTEEVDGEGGRTRGRRGSLLLGGKKEKVVDEEERLLLG
ncbi:hypothetical protein GE09DRAFT_499490 [Coniochaeta sp. 2T2.1]|nr:hypothetical protein GE09DRAFT_499490 [Coniochaeta sp. 2T2.1]